jgi:hypothetical protein
MLDEAEFDFDGYIDIQEAKFLSLKNPVFIPLHVVFVPECLTQCSLMLGHFWSV